MTTIDNPIPSAPITEAIIDIRVSPLEDVPLEALKKLQPKSYPISQPILEFSGEIAAGETISTTVKRQELGYKFSSDSHPYVLQARIDGFTLSRLQPYETWQPFSAEAFSYWQEYRKLIGNTNIERLAVRYINRIDIPLPVEDLSKYFQTRPEVSASLPFRDVSGYMMLLQIPQPDINAFLNFREAIVTPPSEAKDCVSVVLDIDLFRTEQVPQIDSEIWEYFNQALRVRKDEVFFASITKVTDEFLRRRGNQ